LANSLLVVITVTVVGLVECISYIENVIYGNDNLLLSCCCTFSSCPFLGIKVLLQLVTT
jgi:hypothetical protein